MPSALLINNGRLQQLFLSVRLNKIPGVRYHRKECLLQRHILLFQGLLEGGQEVFEGSVAIRLLNSPHSITSQTIAGRP